MAAKKSQARAEELLNEIGSMYAKRGEKIANFMHKAMINAFKGEADKVKFPQTLTSNLDELKKISNEMQTLGNIVSLCQDSPLELSEDCYELVADRLELLMPKFTMFANALDEL